MSINSGDGELAREAWPNAPYPGTVAWAEEHDEEDCQPDARVFIDGVEVPYVGVEGDDNAIETHIRKGGVASITRDSEATVPIEWKGVEIGPVASILKKRPQNAPSVRISLLNPAENYVTCHSGFLRAASPNDGETMRLTVGDFASLFDTVGFSGRYGFNSDYDFNQILDDITSTVEDNHGAIEEIHVADGVQSLYPETAYERPPGGSRWYGTLEETFGDNPIYGPPIKGAEFIASEFEERIVSSQAFTRNKHSAKDALDWLCKTIDAHFWFDWNPQTERTELVIDAEKPRVHFRDVRLDNEEGTTPVIVESANAAFQVSPLHTIEARGHTSLSKAVTSSERDRGEYPYAVVAHEDLRKMVGSIDQPVVEPLKAADTIDETVAEARNSLRKHIDETAGGELICTVEPSLRPYNSIEVQPVCDGRVVGDYPPLEYECQEAVHHVETNDPVLADQGGSRTLVRCGVTTRDSDFTVLESGLQSV